MGLRVWKEKILLVLHLRQLDEESLASRVYKEQLANKWPGLAEEVEKICKQLGVESANSCRLDIKSYKKMITEACHKKNEERIRENTNNSIKCERIKKEEYGRKKYLKETNINYVRELFKARFGLKEFAGNFPNSTKFKKSDWMCKCKLQKEKEDHIKEGNCEAYKDLRQKYDNLDNDNDLLQYFNEVLERRERLEEEEARAGRDSCPLAGGEPKSPPMLLVPAPPGTSRHGDVTVQLVDHP